MYNNYAEICAPVSSPASPQRQSISGQPTSSAKLCDVEPLPLRPTGLESPSHIASFLDFSVLLPLPLQLFYMGSDCLQYIVNPFISSVALSVAGDWLCSIFRPDKA